MTEDNLSEQFLAMLQCHTGIVIKVSRAYAKTAHDREDLRNDIVLELWKSFGKFRGDAKISTWIYRVAFNTAMNFKRRQKHNPLFSFTNDLQKIDAIPWLTEPDYSSETELLHQCIDELAAINKAIILLFLDGNSHEEIAEVTGMTKTNVGTRISRIKEQIKQLAIQKQL